MKSLKDELNQISDVLKITNADIIDTYLCEGCNNEVVVKNTELLFGPKKGTLVPIKYNCKCEDIAISKEVEKKNKEQKHKNIISMFEKYSFVNRELEKATISNYKPKTRSQSLAHDECMRFVLEFNKDNPENLFMLGSYGVGKSHLAIGVLRYLMKQGYFGVFISVPKLISSIKSTWKNSELSEADIFKALYDVDVLVVDDIGVGKTSEYDLGKLWEVFDSRQGKHTIYTSNHTIQELEELDPRNFSRLNSHTTFIEIKGDDYRKSMRKFVGDK